MAKYDNKIMDKNSFDDEFSVVVDSVPLDSVDESIVVVAVSVTFSVDDVMMTSLSSGI